MNWEKFISDRFYQSSNNQGKHLGILSMIGMGVGCFAMLISISVMNGFETIVHGKLKGIEGDIRILGDTNEKELSAINGIKDIMPFMERKGIIEANDLKRVALIKAIDRTNKTDSNKGLLNKGFVPGIVYGKGSQPSKIAFEITIFSMTHVICDHCFKTRFKIIRMISIITNCYIFLST